MISTNLLFLVALFTYLTDILYVCCKNAKFEVISFQKSICNWNMIAWMYFKFGQFCFRHGNSFYRTLHSFVSPWNSVFHLFFDSRHPYLVLKITGGTPKGLFVFIGGTPSTSLRHPSAPRHPGWEPPLWRFEEISRDVRE